MRRGDPLEEANVSYLYIPEKCAGSRRGYPDGDPVLGNSTIQRASESLLSIDPSGRLGLACAVILAVPVYGDQSKMLSIING